MGDRVMRSLTPYLALLLLCGCGSSSSSASTDATEDGGSSSGGRGGQPNASDGGPDSDAGVMGKTGGRGGDGEPSNGDGGDSVGNGNGASDGNGAGDGAGGRNAGGSGGDEPGDGGRGSDGNGNGGESAGGSPVADDEHDTAIVDPIDVDDYLPEEATACQPTNPCPAGQCAEDTHPCVGNYRISEPAQLDEIRECTSIEGSLTLTGDLIETLGPLALRTISRDLRIELRSLESLRGLENLVFVGNNLALGSVLGDGASLLTDLTGLSGLRYVAGDVSITDLPRLQSLDGLELSDAQLLYISNCPQLQDVSALRSVQCVDSLVLSTHDTLADLDELPISGVMHDVQIDRLPLLTSLGALSKLEVVRGDLLLLDLPLLPDLSELGQLKFAGNFQIKDLDLVSGLAGLENLEVVQGRLTLDSAGVTDLTGLSGLLSLGGVTLGASAVTSFEGLTSLRSFGRLDPSHEVSLAGLEQLEHVTYLVTAGEVSLEPLSKLKQIGTLSLRGGELTAPLPAALEAIGTLSLAEVPLVDLEDFSQVLITDGVTISGAEQLTDLSGLQHGGRLLTLQLAGAPALTDLGALEGLVVVEGELSVERTGLSTLAGLSDLQRAGNLRLVENPVLGDVDDLRRLTTLGSGLAIERNPTLGNLSGLAQLSEVDAFAILSVQINDSLPTCEVEAFLSRIADKNEYPITLAHGNDDEASCD